GRKRGAIQRTEAGNGLDLGGGGALVQRVGVGGSAAQHELSRRRVRRVGAARAEGTVGARSRARERLSGGVAWAAVAALTAPRRGNSDDASGFRHLHATCQVLLANRYMLSRCANRLLIGSLPRRVAPARFTRSRRWSNGISRSCVQSPSPRSGT